MAGTQRRARYEATLHDWTDADSIRAFETATRRRRRRRRVVVALVTVATLIAAAAISRAVVPSIWYRHSVYNKRYLIGKYGYQLSEPARAQLFNALPDLESFVEQQRGGRFLRPVTLRFIADDFFFNVLGTPTDVDTRDAVALGFAKNETDVHQQLKQLQEVDIPGFYDAREHVLNIRGQEFDDYAQVVLVHELTKAYDDQHFNLGAVTHAAGDEFDARSALVEGDAVTVQNAFTETLPVGERCLQLTDSLQPYDAACRAATYGPRSQESNLSRWPLQAETVFPSVMGPRFISALTRSGGHAAVDAAFRHPPTTTAQIIDPASYLAGAQPVAVPVPEVPTGADGARRELGALQLSTLVSGGLLGVGTSRYVHGWRGDSAVSYDAKAKSCLTANVGLGTPTAADVFVARLHSWQVGHDRAFRRLSPTLVQLRQCVG